jgi:hypothetical protein
VVQVEHILHQVTQHLVWQDVEVTEIIYQASMVVQAAQTLVVVVVVETTAALILAARVVQAWLL